MKKTLALALLTAIVSSCTADNPDYAPPSDGTDAAVDTLVDAAPPPPDLVPIDRTPPRTNLVGYWSFDRSGSTALDDSGYQNDGTVRRAVQVLGKVGSAYRFDGDACITAPRSPSLDFAGKTALTEMAWVNLGVCPQDRLDAGSVNWGVILAKNGEYEHGIYCGSMPVYQESISTAGTGSWVWNGSELLDIGTWHHVAATWDGATVHHYVDGAKVFERAVSGGVRPAFGPSGLGIGCGNIAPDGSGGGYFFVGTIDEVALYDRALSAAEIADYYGRTK